MLLVLVTCKLRLDRLTRTAQIHHRGLKKRLKKELVLGNVYMIDRSPITVSDGGFCLFLPTQLQLGSLPFDPI